MWGTADEVIATVASIRDVLLCQPCGINVKAKSEIYRSLRYIKARFRVCDLRLSSISRSVDKYYSEDGWKATGADNLAD